MQRDGGGAGEHRNEATGERGSGAARGSVYTCYDTSIQSRGN